MLVTRRSAGALLGLVALLSLSAPITDPHAALAAQSARGSAATDSLPPKKSAAARPSASRSSGVPGASSDTAAAGPSIAGLTWRSIGPAVMSGRIVDLAIHPRTPRTWFIAAGSGGVWKTVNAGTTFTPVFDAQSTYSIGAITIDPNNPNVIWVGSGENN